MLANDALDVAAFWDRTRFVKVITIQTMNEITEWP
jgi:hypothetical protein